MAVTVSIADLVRQACEETRMSTPPAEGYKPAPKAADDFTTIAARMRQLESERMARVSGDWPDGGG